MIIFEFKIGSLDEPREKVAKFLSFEIQFKAEKIASMFARNPVNLVQLHTHTLTHNVHYLGFAANLQ